MANGTGSLEDLELSSEWLVMTDSWRSRLPCRITVAVMSAVLALAGSAGAAPWSGFLDPTRAIDWSSAGTAIPNYTVNCATQLTGTNALVANNQSAAAANTTKIQNAINSCDATHNVVNIPAGTFYVTSINVQTSNVVVRGAGPNLTTIIPTTGTGCGGEQTGICLIAPNNTYGGSPDELPGGSRACDWTAGYAQGTTSITLNNCGGPPPLGAMVVLDQANDTTDTGGIYICSTDTKDCALESITPGDNANGRHINGLAHSEQQVTKILTVTGSGTGPYTVTIPAPGIYFTNVRSGKANGAWWFDTGAGDGSAKSDGLENLTVDGQTMSQGSPTDFRNIQLFQCDQCWVRNVRSMNAGRNHVQLFQTYQSVVRDSYFYGAIGSGSQSYGIEIEIASANLIENNIFQRTTAPIMFGAGTGNVIDYNYTRYDWYGGTTTVWDQAAYYSHNAGNEMNLFEGNNLADGPWGDESWGSTDQVTLFRNMQVGWQAGKSEGTIPFIARTRVRAINVVGNVLGQPGYHQFYQSYPTATGPNFAGVACATPASGSCITYPTESSDESQSIFSMGWVLEDGGCTCGTAVGGCELINNCETMVKDTLMRWGNWDTVTGATQWNTDEASPQPSAACALAGTCFFNSNFSAGYFGTLTHTLPASLYYSSKPSWWPATKAWPPIGPDVSSGNLGICSGNYAGAQATSSSQCTGGTLSTAWASHANSIPAQDCYLNVMGGPPDGTGSVLSFNANTCYGSNAGTSVQAPARPEGLTWK